MGGILIGSFVPMAWNQLQESGSGVTKLHKLNYTDIPQIFTLAYNISALSYVICKNGFKFPIF